LDNLTAPTSSEGGPAQVQPPQTTRRSKIRTIPDLCSRNFTGRSDLLHKLDAALDPSHGPDHFRRAALWGLPGVGKSQLALQYATRYGDKYDYIFFIRAQNEMQIEQDYKIIWQRLGLSEVANMPRDQRLIIDGVKAWLESNSAWLLVYDNVHISATVRQHLPLSGNGSLLYTALDGTVAQDLADDGLAYEVLPLTKPESVQLVYNLFGIDTPDAITENATDVLCEIVRGLPLALEQTVTQCRRQNVALDVQVRKMQAKKSELLKNASPTSLHERNPSTAALFEMTVDNLGQSAPGAVALLDLLLFLDTSYIPLSLVEDGATHFRSFLDRSVTFDRGTNRRTAQQKLYEMKMSQAAQSHKERLSSKWKPALLNKTGSNIVEPPADAVVRKFLADNEALQTVFRSQTQIRAAIVDLVSAGLVRRNDPDSISIHDLVRDILIESLEMKQARLKNPISAQPRPVSPTPHLSQAPASEPPFESTGMAQIQYAAPFPYSLLTLTLVYLAYPHPTSYPFSQKDRCILYLAHALIVLQHNEQFLLSSVAATELCHIVGSTYDLNRYGKEERMLKASVEWYRKAYHGYRIMERLDLEKKKWEEIRQENRRIVEAEDGYTMMQRLINDHERFGSASLRAAGAASIIANLLMRLPEGDADAGIWATTAKDAFVDLLGMSNEVSQDAVTTEVHALSNLKDWRGALESAKLLKYPDELLGKLYERVGDYESAVLWMERTMREKEAVNGLHHVWPFWSQYGRCLRKAGRFKDAIKACELALESATLVEDFPEGFSKIDRMIEASLRVELGISVERANDIERGSRLVREGYETMKDSFGSEDFTKADLWLRLRIIKMYWNMARIFATRSDHELDHNSNDCALQEARRRYGEYREWSGSILPTDLDYDDVRLPGISL
jgi:tetratricopeptide (TPR) repeat protein